MSFLLKPFCVARGGLVVFCLKVLAFKFIYILFSFLFLFLRKLSLSTITSTTPKAWQEAEAGILSLTVGAWNYSIQI